MTYDFWFSKPYEIPDIFKWANIIIKLFLHN